MEIKVKLEIGLAKELETILMALPQLLSMSQETTNTAAVVPIQAEKPEPAPVEPEPERPAGQKEFTEEDVRAAMERARVRIEGDDWSEKKSELYKRYHKALTQEFKNISAFLGADKPSMLAAENREQFILWVDDLWGEDGEIKASKDLPF